MLNRLLSVGFFLLVLWGFSLSMQSQPSSLPAPSAPGLPTPIPIVAIKSPQPSLSDSQIPRGPQDDLGDMLSGANQFLTGFARLFKRVLVFVIDESPEPFQGVVGLVVLIVCLFAFIGLQTFFAFARMLSRLGG